MEWNPRAAVGQGQFDSRAQKNSKDEVNRHPKAGQSYDTASFSDLVKLAGNPKICPKGEAYWMLSSLYNEPDARTFSVQEEKGYYAFLLVDIDKGNKSLDEVRQAVCAILPNTGALLNSTASATAKDRRWHITLQCDKWMPYPIFKAYQNALFARFEARGFTVDKALARAAQLFFLPSKATPESFYQWADVIGVPLKVGTGEGLCAEARRLFDLESQEKARVAANAKRGTNDRTSVIGWVNYNFTTEDLLELYGYAFDGKEWASPYQQHSSGGKRHSTMVRPDGSWFSWSASDDAAGVGIPSRGGRHGDAFDLISHYAFNGELNKALAWAKCVRRKNEAENPAMQSVMRWVESATEGRNR